RRPARGGAAAGPRGLAPDRRRRRADRRARDLRLLRAASARRLRLATFAPPEAFSRRGGAVRRVPMGAGAAAGLMLAAVVTALPAQAAPAGDGPGAVSHFDLARKDCLGTAQN